MQIEVRNLNAGYEKDVATRPVLRNLSFTAKAGRRLCVMGANGSGKTTLLRALIGAIPTTGEILYDDAPLSQFKRTQIGMRVAVLTQLNRSYFSYTVEETVSQGRYARRRGWFSAASKSDKEAVERVLETIGLSDLRRRQIGALSGGQLQRVFLARALAQETPALLLDEPTNHLDLKYQEELTDYLLEWSQGETTTAEGVTYRNTLIGVFHDINLALTLAEDVCLLKDGAALAIGARDEALSKGVLADAFDMDVAAYMQKILARWK